jgi:serine/threonine protein kinase
MKLRHPNVVLFMGACTRQAQAVQQGGSGELCLVMEYAKHGSLYHVLHNPQVQIDLHLVLRWALETARGMNYLHTRR